MSEKVRVSGDGYVINLYRFHISVILMGLPLDEMVTKVLSVHLKVIGSSRPSPWKDNQQGLAVPPTCADLFFLDRGFRPPVHQQKESQKEII